MLKLTIYKQISVSITVNNFVTVAFKQKTNGMELECKQPVSCNSWWQIEAVDHVSGYGNIMHNFNVSQLTI